MKTYLILYAERPTRKVFQEERPGRLILASDEITDDDLKVYDQCVQLPPVVNVAETVKILEKIKFDEIVVQTEYGLLPGSLVAHQRGLRTPTPEAILLCSNKWLSREACKNAGVPVPEYKLVESAAEVAKFAQKLPIIIKPIASTLGRLVMKVETRDELESLVHKLLRLLPQAPDILRCAEFTAMSDLKMECDPFRQFLVEEYIDGVAEETDGLVFTNTICLFGGIKQIITYRHSHFFIDAYILSSQLGSKLEQVSHDAIRASKLTDSGFSIEMRNGKIIEINGRLGEDDGFPQLFKSALGKYPIIKWLEQDTSMPHYESHFGLAYFNWYDGGVVKEIRGNGKMQLIMKNGSLMYAPPHPDAVPHVAYAIAEGKDDDECLQLARKSLEHLEFVIE